MFLAYVANQAGRAALKKAGQWKASSKAEELQKAAAAKSPAQRQYDYDVARRSVLGELAQRPPTCTQQCMASAKAASRERRLELTGRALSACPERTEEATRLRRDMDEVENMRCAQHVYLANDPNAPEDLRNNPPPGFRKATDAELAEMGLKPKMLEPDDSKFRAAVYMKDEAVWGPNPNPPSVLAFRGSTPALEDWQNNFAQGMNFESPYYKSSVEIGNALASNNAKTHIVGHSLGGGLASAAQGGSGLTASTYNAAGLHSATVARYSQDARHMAADPNKINAIRVKGEVLTDTQESGFSGLLAPNAVGRKRDLAPATTPEQFEQLKQQGKLLPKDDYVTHLHGMNEVIAATEQQKQSDEAALQNCLKQGRAGPSR
jgi:hypothetical protein